MYIEGWWVAQEYQQQGIGSALVLAAEEWGKANHFREIASDAFADNTQSLRAHRSLGFSEHAPIIPFYKPL
ncbi:MAG: GNAT family N-acetyltransferase [Fimbriimonadaceae bacterium]